jgi:hypothetical protein
MEHVTHGPALLPSGFEPDAAANICDDAEHRVWFLHEATRHHCEKPAV